MFQGKGKMTTYWLVGEKPTNNNVQEINVSAVNDQQNSSQLMSNQRQQGPTVQILQQPLLQPQNQNQNQLNQNPRNPLTVTGNCAPPCHSTVNISPAHQQRTTSVNTVSGNSVHQTHQQIHPSDNVPNHTETGPNAPLLLPAGSIPRD